MLTEPDDPSRLTKQQAAAALHVTPKTIEAFVKDGKLDPRRWRPSTGGQWRVVFLAEDVARLAAERQGGPAVPFVVRAPAGSANGNGHQGATALQRPPADLPSGEDVLRLVFAMAQRALTGDARAEAEKAAKAEKSVLSLFLTVEEGAAYLNWTPRDLRRAIREGDVPCRNKERRDWRTWRIRRRDLEAL